MSLPYVQVIYDVRDVVISYLSDVAVTTLAVVSSFSRDDVARVLAEEVYAHRSPNRLERVKLVIAGKVLVVVRPSDAWGVGASLFVPGTSTVVACELNWSLSSILSGPHAAEMEGRLGGAEEADSTNPADHFYLKICEFGQRTMFPQFRRQRMGAPRPHFMAALNSAGNFGSFGRFGVLQEDPPPVVSLSFSGPFSGCAVREWFDINHWGGSILPPASQDVRDPRIHVLVDTPAPTIMSLEDRMLAGVNSLASVDLSGLTDLRCINHQFMWRAAGGDGGISVRFGSLPLLESIGAEFCASSGDVKRVDLTGLTSLTSYGSKFLASSGITTVLLNNPKLEVIGGGFLAQTKALRDVDLTSFTAVMRIEEDFCSGSSVSSLGPCFDGKPCETTLMGPPSPGLISCAAIGKNFLANTSQLRALDLSSLGRVTICGGGFLASSGVVSLVLPHETSRQWLTPSTINDASHTPTAVTVRIGGTIVSEHVAIPELV